MALEALVGSMVGELVASAGHSLLGSLGAAWGLKDELKKLERLLAKIKDVLADAEEEQIGNVAVRMWLHALKKTAYDAEDVVDLFNYETLRHKAAAEKNTVAGVKVRDFFSSHNQIVFRLKMGRKLQNVLKRIEDIVSEGTKLNLSASNVQPETSLRETSPFIVESDVVGRNKDREKIVRMLINNSTSEKNHITVLPIVGMPGLGKTTMAQLIYNDPRVVNYFQLRGWVYVSEDWDMAKIIERAVASITGQKFEQPTLELKQRGLREALNGKRYLIVLDDIRKEDRAEWDALRGILDCGGSKGSAIIVTTRSERVGKITGTVKSHDLPYLSEDESWTLFSSKSFAPGAEMPENLVEIGRAIVNKCGGLPLAIKMLGSTLYMKSDIRHWLEIKDSSVWDIENNNILPALRLSYKHLPWYSKRCFAFCAVLPNYKWIQKEKLIQMWMAHGFIPSSESLDVKGRKIFNQLVQRSFLESEIKLTLNSVNGFPAMETLELNFMNDDVTICRMHDLVRDLAQSIVGKECISLSSNGSSKVAKQDVYHLSFSGYSRSILDIEQTIKGYSNLRTLLISPSISGKKTNIFPQYTFLRVLQIDRVTSGLPIISTKSLQHLRYLELSCYEMSELPESICALLHLQTLDLSGCRKLSKLPESIYMLPNLQVLNLGGCENLCKLPEKMQCMSALRNLHLERCYNLKNMPAGMGQMTNLETLTMYVVSDEYGRGIQELQGLHLLFKLELYNLRCVKDAEEARNVNLHSKDVHRLALYWREPDHYSHFNYNKARNADTHLNQENEEKVLEKLKPPGRLKFLKIRDYNGLKFPPWMVGCQNLVELYLGYCTRSYRLPPLWRLNSLESLSLKRMDNLKYIFSDDVQPFPSLKKLRLHSLGRLEGWWEKKKAALCFPSLVYLEIDQCPELTGSMPLLSRLQGLKLAESNKIQLGSVLPNKTLSSLRHHLQCIENLSIKKFDDEAALMWHDQEDEEMSPFGSCLENMEIAECDWLFSSRRSGLWRSMASLERLMILSCHADALVDMFEVLQGLKSLRNLEIRVSPNAPTANTPPTIDARLPPQLESLRFFYCESLTTLMLRCPASLKSLGIHDCPNLVSLTAAEQELGQLASLEAITLGDCDKLKSLALEEMGGLAALRDLSIYNCRELTSLPECLLQRLPSLEHLRIEGCPQLEKKCTSGGE